MSDGAAWAAATPLPALGRALARLDAPDAETVAALVRPLLEDAGWLDAVVAGFARDARADPGFAPPLAPLASPLQAGLLLYHDRHVALFAGVGDHAALAAKRLAGDGGGAIVFPGQLGLVRVLRAGGARLSLWRGGWRDGTLAPRCRPIGARTTRDGETFVVDGRDTAYLVERATGDFAWLQAAIAAGAAPTTAEYDAGTRALVGVGAARDEPSRRQMLATLLAETGQAAPAAFDRASRMAEPFARWHVMRAWLSADAAAARGRLAEMAAADGDGEVRTLARDTLALVDAACRG